MELKQIKELMAAMVRSGITKVVLKREGEFELQLEKQNEAIIERVQVGGSIARSEYDTTISSPLPVAKPAEPLFHPNAGQAPVDDSSKYVTSPMVGTFYTTPSPDDPPFVKVGDRIEVGTVVCIIEAMKVMNEVKAGVAGTIAEVLVPNGHPVEFGTKLYRVV